ncbi:dnaJ homolog subfamily C member 7 homolog [Harmonia axyridis]|uniref:dnaJ homolog subfamily C member 7 homolog n=1 Tax=Harmonia axyridis TaxID=115357 RepID=UPI001E278055|nr:dnaJ homolog subfamily C member 7 homolog [Harmonia axyridis]
MSLKDIEVHDEEFNNFMMKVTEVQKIVQKLASTDENEQAIGNAEAKKYLGENEEKEEIIDVDNLKLKVKCDRTLINKKAFEEMSSNDQSTMSQGVFMKEVEKDADRRYQDRKIRQEKMETLKKQATLAFNREDFVKALSCYNKALDLVKDNHNLFLNRGFTYIKLKLYEKALSDIDRALYLNENSLKGYLLKAKIFFLTNNKTDMDRVLQEAKERHPKKVDFIDGYLQDINEQ